MASYLSLLTTYLIDEDGQIANVPIYVSVDDGQTLAQMVSEATTVGTLINNITGSQILSVSIGANVPIDGSWRPSPGIGSRNNMGALIKFTTQVANREYGIVIPSILPSKLSGSRLNTGDSDVAAFINHMDANTPPYLYASKEGLRLTGFSGSFLNVRKSSPRDRRRIVPV